MDNLDLDQVKAPQYIDFNELNDDVDDSFFDRNDADMDSLFAFCIKQVKGSSANANPELEDVETADEKVPKVKEKKERKVYRFTAAPGAVAKFQAKNATSAKSRESQRVKQCNKNTRNKRQFGTKENLPTRTSLKRPATFGNPRPAKQLKKATQPTTPECLKRSQKSSKVIKTSEQLELEHIAKLRKQTQEHLKANKQNMKKIIQGSALKPINPDTQKPAGAKAKTVKPCNFKGPAPVAKPLLGRNTRSKALQNLENCKSILSVTAFGIPLRTSTPFAHMRSDIAAKNLQGKEKVKANERKKFLTSTLDHSGIPFIQKGKQLTVSRLEEKNKSIVSNLEKSVKNLSDSNMPVCIAVNKMSFKELNEYLPSHEIEKQLGAGKNCSPEKQGKNLNDSITPLCIAVNKMSFKELNEYLPSHEIEKQLGAGKNCSTEKQAEKSQNGELKKFSVVVEKLPYEKYGLPNKPNNKQRRQKATKSTEDTENTGAQVEIPPVKKGKLFRKDSENVASSPLNDVTSAFRNQPPLRKSTRLGSAAGATMSAKESLASQHESKKSISKCTRSQYLKINDRETISKKKYSSVAKHVLGSKR